MRKVVTVVALLGAVAAIAAGIAVGAGGRDSETPITGTALERASDAALAHTGGGRVTDTEAGDEQGDDDHDLSHGSPPSSIVPDDRREAR